MPSLFELFDRYGLALVFANVLAEQAGLPIPAVPALVVAGAVSRDAGQGAPLLVAVAWIAAMIADVAWYLGGRRYGHRILRTLCRVSLSPDSCVARTEAAYGRWGARSLVVAKFLPGFSTLAPPLSGTLGLSVARFLFLDGLGSLLWIGASVAGGAMFHRQVDVVLAVLESMGRVSLVLIVLALGALVLVKWIERQRLMRTLRMDRITPDELRRMLANGESPVVVDVRTPLARTAEPKGVPGAHFVALAEIDRGTVELPRDREVIVYCNCPNEISAARAAARLKRIGYERVRPLLGGLDAWTEIDGAARVGAGVDASSATAAESATR